MSESNEPKRQNPRLSILMSAYNAEQYLEDAIQSILAQTFTDFELIVADDASSDRTRCLIDDFKVKDTRIVVSHNQDNLGKIATVNRLSYLAQGEYLTVHDADDVSKPLRFEKQMNFLEQRKDYLMCGTRFTYVNEKLETLWDEPGETDYEEIRKKLPIGSQFHGPTMVFRTSFLSDSHPVYREFFRDYNEDYDLSYRLVQNGPCANLPDFEYLYRVVPGSYSKSLTPRKKAMKQVLLYLAKQREQTGADDLMRNQLEEVNLIIEAVEAEYKKDPSRIHRENANLMMYFKSPWASVNHGWKAFRTDPFNLKNLKSMLYPLYKRLTSGA